MNLTARKLIARKILLIAKNILSKDGYEYIYDPEHKKSPGSGFKQTEKGWSRTNSNSDEKAPGNSKTTTKTNKFKPVSKKFQRMEKRGIVQFVKIQKLKMKLTNELKKNEEEISKLDAIRKSSIKTGKNDPEVTKRLNALYRKRKQYSERLKYSTLESLQLPKEHQGSIKLSIKKLPDDQRKSFEFASRALGRVLNKRFVPGPVLNVEPENSKSATVRSAYYHDESKIKIKPGEEFKVYLHEMAHYIEDNNPQVEALCREFLKQRTAGDKPKKLKTLFKHSNYDEDEWTKEDNFPDPYCGKIYSRGSEILSMGIEMIVDNPFDFYRKDPGYFGLIVSILKGDIEEEKVK